MYGVDDHQPRTARTDRSIRPIGVAVMAAGIIAAAPSPAASSARWDVLIEPDLGTKVEVPTDIFSVPYGSPGKGIGRQFRTKDGRAILSVYSLDNRYARNTPTTYLRKNLKVTESAMDYIRVTETFFAISGVHEGSIWYSRCNFSRTRGGAVHCFDLKYPSNEKRAWDPIVTRISLSLRPLER